MGAAGTLRGFGAGDAYPQVWLRDSATILPLSRYLYPREYLTSWVEEHFAHQMPGGELFDWIAGGPAASFAPWAPRARTLSTRGAPPLAGDKNTVESDQEASAVLALCRVYSITGDRGWLLKPVGARALLERAHRALQSMLVEKLDRRTGLITSGFSADWGDVSPVYPDQRAIYLDEHTPRVVGLYTNALFFGAAVELAQAYGSVEDTAQSAYWTRQAANVKAQINRHLWQETRGFYRMHVAVGPVPPPSFDDSDILAMGGNAIAMLTGVADPSQGRRILEVIDGRRRSCGVSTIAGVLLPPYPRGTFKHSAMSEEYSYQNGGQWDWFAGRLLSAAFAGGQAEWARRNLREVARRVVVSGGLYEWHTRDGRGRGSASYAGSAGALAQAVFEGLFGVSLAADRASVTVRLGEDSGSIHLYQPATETYLAYDYVATTSRLSLRYDSNHPRAGMVSILVPPGRQAMSLRLDGNSATFQAATVGDDCYARFPTDWGPHRAELNIAPRPGPTGR